MNLDDLEDPGTYVYLPVESDRRAELICNVLSDRFSRRHNIRIVVAMVAGRKP